MYNVNTLNTPCMAGLKNTWQFVEKRSNCNAGWKYNLLKISFGRYEGKEHKLEHVVLNSYHDTRGTDLSTLNYTLSLVSRAPNLIIGTWKFAESS